MNTRRSFALTLASAPAMLFGALAISLFALALPSFASAQSVPSSCPSASAQETLNSSLQQLTELADTLLVENLPQTVISADQNLVSAISQAVLQITEACYSGTATTAPSNTLPATNQTSPAAPVVPPTNANPAPSVPVVPALSLNGATTGSYTVGTAWALTLTSPFDAVPFTFCDIQNGVQSCTPNWGTTNANGNWSATGSFDASTVGSWTEWGVFPSGATSTKLSFTVAAAPASGSNPASGTAITGVQGYDPSTLAYTDGTALINTYLIIYGNFGASNNAVAVNGTAVTPTYQSANQINVSLSGISAANQNTVTVTTPTGGTGSANFTITNSGESAPASTTTTNITGPSQTATGSLSVCSGSPTVTATFPAAVTVTASSLYVRSSPDATAPLAGSEILSAGDVFTATNEVQGQCVNGNNLWWVSSLGNYVWAGGTQVEASATTSAGTPSSRQQTTTSSSRAKSTTEAVTDSSGNQYTITYTTLPDGEIQATFMFDGQEIAVENNTYGVAASGGGLSGSGFTTIPATLVSSSQAGAFGSLISQIETYSSANQASTIPGFTFRSSLFSSPGEYNASFFASLPDVGNGVGLVTLMTNSNGNVIGLANVGSPNLTAYVVNAGVVIDNPSGAVTSGQYTTTYTLYPAENSNTLSSTPIPLGNVNVVDDASGNPTEITADEVSSSGAQSSVTFTVGAIQLNNSAASAIPTATVLGNLAPATYLSNLMSGLQGEGYQVSQNTDALGQTAGAASINGGTSLYFSLGDQVVSWNTANIGGSCIVDAPNGTPVPVMAAPNGNGGITIPHLDKNFNLAIDPSAFALWENTFPYNVGSSSEELLQSDLITLFNQGYYPYTQVSGLPQPTENLDAGAVVILSFGNIPDTDNWTYQNGQYANTPTAIAAQAITLIPGSTPYDSNYVPSGSSNAIISALNAGKEVMVITLNSQVFGPSSSADDRASLPSTIAHEMGHPLGLGDDYTNGQSPMREETSSAPIAIPQGIAEVLSTIQSKGSLTAVTCAPPYSSNVGTTPTQMIQGLVPIVSTPGSGGTIQWGYAGSCTDEQLSSGWLNAAACTGSNPPPGCNGASQGCYLPVPTSTSVLSFGNFPDQPDASTCLDNYGAEYTCASTNCGAAGQLACPANIPTDTCLDSGGGEVSCPDGLLPLPAISAPPVPTDEQGGYECSSDGSCIYNPDGGSYSDATCDDACGDN